MDITLDLETNRIEGLPGDLSWLKVLYCVGYCYEDAEGVEYSGYLPFHNVPLDKVTSCEAGRQLQTWLTDWTPNFHNAPFDVWVLRYLGFEVPFYHDTMVMGYLVNPNISMVYQPGHKPARYSVWAWSVRLKLPTKFEGGEDIFDSWSSDLAKRSTLDAWIQFQLFKYLKRILTKDSVSWQHYLDIERPFIECVMEIEETGMLVNEGELLELIKDLDIMLSGLHKQMVDLVGLVPSATRWFRKPHPERVGVYEGDLVDGFETRIGKDGRTEYGYKILGWYNPGSAEQTAYALQTIYGWEPTDIGKSGVAKTNKDIISELEYELAELKLEYNSVRILITTFCKAFLTRRDKWGYIHTRVNNTTTRTGRLSTSQPNLQNLPVRTELGKRVRSVVVAPPEYTIVDIDLQAIEYRVLAALMYDYWYPDVPPDVQFMVNVFNCDPNTEEGDIHTQMANLWFPHMEDRKKARKLGKNISYGRMFGFGAGKASRMMTRDTGELITKEVAQGLIDQANENNPSLPLFKEIVWDEFISGEGVGHTFFGRRLVYPEIMLRPTTQAQKVGRGTIHVPKGQAKERLAKAKRQAFNAKIQGTAADIIKMLCNQSMQIAWNHGARLVLQVHDELIFYCPTADVGSFVPELNAAFYYEPDALLPGVLVMGTAETGQNWRDTHE